MPTAARRPIAGQGIGERVEPVIWFVLVVIRPIVWRLQDVVAVRVL